MTHPVLHPVIVQDNFTDKVLGLFYWNAETHQKTKADNDFYYWDSTTNSMQKTDFVVQNILATPSSFLVKVASTPPQKTEFGEENTGKARFLNHLKMIIRDRKENPSGKSYTTSLFKKGINKCAQKVGEEAVELVIEAMDSNDDLFRNEGADLLYHLLVLTEAKEIDFDELIEVLIARHQ